VWTITNKGGKWLVPSTKTGGGGGKRILKGGDGTVVTQIHREFVHQREGIDYAGAQGNDSGKIWERESDKGLFQKKKGW